MKILLVHQNFPAQFVHLGPELARRGHEVAALSMIDVPPMPGVTGYRSIAKVGTKSEHQWALDTEAKLIRAHAATVKASAMRRDGYVPDVIVAHPGWGDTLFLKDVWPEARLALYCEFFYGYKDSDHDFDPEFPPVKDEIEHRCGVKVKQLPQRLMFPMANAGISPTHFQASSYPRPFADRITVIHDGIDTDKLRPRDDGHIKFASGTSLTRADEVVTFVGRNLEPYRGYHIFMRALPELQRLRPRAHFVIIGGDGVSYGRAADKGTTWKETFLNEVRAQLDMSRIHFVGRLNYAVFTEVLSLSRLHIYLTYPFVLSWSMLEAMALGAPILGSDTAPVRELIRDGENGMLTPFFEPKALAERAAMMLADDALRTRLSANARQTIVDGYDLKTRCLPRQIEWVEALEKMDPLPPMFEG